MGQKVRPTGFRTGIMTDWQSRWFAGKHDFADLLLEDQKIRKYIKGRFEKGERGTQRSGIARIKIERTRERVTVFIHSARVGVIIGKKGATVDELTKELEDLTHRVIEVKTMEVNRPEVDPQLVAEDIAEQLEKRASFRRTMKRTMDQTMEAGARGVRIRWRVVWAGRRWPARRAAWPAAFRCPRCVPRSSSVSRKRIPPRGTLASRCGSTTATTWIRR